MREEVKLLFGTDTPSDDGIGNPPGLNGRIKLGRWFEAGVPLSQILRGYARQRQDIWAAKDLGTIEVGKRANLLLLRADPLKTITAYDTIDTVFVDGNGVARGDLLASN